MNRDFVDRLFTMSTSGTLDSILREQGLSGLSALANEWGYLAVRGILDIEKEIGADTKDGTRWNARTD
jgi:hypothetical protein